MRIAIEPPSTALPTPSWAPPSIRISQVEERTAALERRIDQVEADRQAAEYRIHANTEHLLDGLLREVRAIADLLTR